MKRMFCLIPVCFIYLSSYCWGFYAHKQINQLAVYLLPPEMLVFYKPNQGFLEEHATDPDKRRYAVLDEGPRHYIDLDRYRPYPYDSLPRKWDDAVARFSVDSLMAHGIVPWHILLMQRRLVAAFKIKDPAAILRNSAELGHYIADAHVPLHTSSNHNGQFTNQHGIHGFWESSIPELLAATDFDFFIGKAQYIPDPAARIWRVVLESSLAADTVLLTEKNLSKKFPSDKKYAFELRNGKLIRQYASAYTLAYNRHLNGMVERRMRESIECIASFWYSAWVEAGQPDLKPLQTFQFSESDKASFEQLNKQWAGNESMLGRGE